MATMVNAPVSDVRDNLADLRRGSLGAVAPILGIISYVWLILVAWPVTGRNAPLAAWIGSLLLVFTLIASYFLRERVLSLSSAILLVGLVLTIVCAMIAYQVSHLGYLFVLPICLAGMLLGSHAITLTTIASLLLIGRLNTFYLHCPLVSPDILLPMGLAATIAVVSWLFERNQHTALEWAWNGFEQARQNEQVSRQRRAELRQTLKALDEAMYRLERTNHMLTVALEQADEAQRGKQQFVQTISHELRTPLNLIIGFAELMVQSPEHYGVPLPSPYRRDMSIVFRNACHLSDLVNDVLDMARIGAAEMTLTLEETSPAELVLETVNTARSLVESRGLTLSTEIEPDLPGLRVDPARIRQVLFNLLNNAARFTEQGSVTVEVRQAENEVIFAVRDTGTGIAEEDIPKVFQEFKQLDGGTRRRHSGVGLGLAISKSFVELHGGRIWCESKLGVGSTFFFALPVQHANVAISYINRQSTHVVSKQDDQCLLLAVTRSLSTVGLLTRYLQSVRTVVAQDLEQAHRVAEHLLPQVVVIDVASVPATSDQIETLKRTWNIPDIPLVVCPFPGEEPMRRKLDTAGYLTKPVTAATLWDVMREFGGGIDRVLIVDDDEDFVRLMTRLLDNPVRRYAVRSAYSGQETLEMLRRWEPDLVLLDIGLPDISGYQIIEHMHANDRWQSIPIIVITGQDTQEMSLSLPGSVTITKTGSLTPDEAIHWIRGVVDTVMHRSPFRQQ